MDAFSGKQLRDGLSLLLHLEKNGARSIGQAKEMIERTIATPSRLPAKPEMKLCPHCNEPMVYGHPVDNLVRLGCRQCRYSEVVQ